MRIEELVSMDMQGEFRSDVQLSDFDNPNLNRELLKNYIFTVFAPVTYGAAQRSMSAKDVLERLKTLFTVAKAENRLVLTANYGHGKSHLALVLANFFARPSNSEEVKIILSRLEQALNNPPQFAGYRDFKKSKGEFLVVRLQGDSIGDLQEGFLRALEQALNEHDSTRGLKLPFWYRNAEEWLKNLRGEMRQQAEAYLAHQNTDVPSLMENLRQQGAYELVRELAKHVTGMYPDFGHEISLDEIIIWIVDEICIPRNFGGLLILFDEFSLFLQKYSRARTVGKLQELLNGIARQQGKSAFLAFSQHDVDTIAEEYAKGQRLEDVRHELERLPRDQRARLYSLMESVLASYLKQDKHSFETWLPPMKPYLARAREIVLEHFDKRYTQELKWDVLSFDEKVVRGCFPLHPLTAAILSNHNFESGAGENPRTALQFVRLAWQDLFHQPAQLPDGKPNFIYPIALVDFFGAQLSKKWYAAYLQTLESTPQVLEEEQVKVLKGLLVQQSVDLKAQAGGQVELLSHLSGLEREEVKRALKELAAQKLIQSDPINKVSFLWPASARPQEIEEIIQKAIDETPIDQALMEKITARLSQLNIPLDFGHASDWSPKQVALTAEMFTVEELKKLFRPYNSGINGIEEGPRGLVIWLIAQSDEEKIQLRQNAQSVLNDAIGSADHPMPIVMMLPKQASPSMIASARRLKALENLKQSEREKIGSVFYQQEKGLAEVNFTNALNELVSDVQGYSDLSRNPHEFVLPSVYRASVQALKTQTLKAVMTECYRQAYAYRVKFYTQYPISGKGPNKLREAVQKVALWLFNDTAGNSIRNLGGKDIQYQLSTLYLTQEWGLLAADTYAIQRPTLRALQHAWDLLEETFAPGCSEIYVRQVLLSLLNPPYGHDYFTLTLLLAAWIGFHQHELRFSLGGKVVSSSQLRTFFDESKNPQDFLNRICVHSPLAISRSQPDEIFKQVNAVLDHIRQGKPPFSFSEAEGALEQLEQALAMPRLPEDKKAEIEQYRSRLEEALGRAREYDQKAREWLLKVDKGDFDELLRLCDGWKEFPTPSLVSTNQPPCEELQEHWDIALQASLESYCKKYVHLTDLADYKIQETNLKHARKALEQYPAFAQRVDQALEILNKRRSELQKQEQEKHIIQQIDNMSPSAALQDLYHYRDELTRLTDLSPQTVAKRDGKLNQIENRIRQFEQIAKELPEAVNRVATQNELRQQRDLLNRNLEQSKGTTIYQSLVAIEEKIRYLDAFFDKLQEIKFLPRNEPDDLKYLQERITEAKTQFSAWLSPTQLSLLEKQEQNIEQIRQQKVQEAQEWLMKLAQRFTQGENPENLLRQIETPHIFLRTEDLTRLEQLKQALQKRLNENVLLQIEILFRKITDVELRRQCLNRLQALMDK